MAIQTLGASHLATEGYEVQRTNNFEIQIEAISNENKKRYLTLAVVSGFLPNESNEVITLNYGNTKVTVAGVSNFNNSGSLVVRDLLGNGENSDIESIIDEWRSQVAQKDGKIGFAHTYKKPAKVTQYAPDGTLERVWDLEGVWPSGVDYGAVNYDSPGAKTINITLQYDKATINRGNSRSSN